MEQSKVTSAATLAKTKNEVYRAIGTDHPPPAAPTLSKVKGCATFREARRLFAAVTDDDDDILTSLRPPTGVTEDALLYALRRLQKVCIAACFG